MNFKRLTAFFHTSDFPVFLSTIFLAGAAVGLFNGVLNNFLAEILAISRFERGVVEFLRELPGMALMLGLALLYRQSETRLIRIALIVGCCGMAGVWLSGPQRVFSIACLVLWSTGEHLLMPVRQAIAIHSAQAGKEGRALGITGSFMHIGQVAGFYIVPLLFLLVKTLGGDQPAIAPFRAVFLTAVLFLFAGILLSTCFHRSTHHLSRERLYIRKKYLRYYILEMFFGARKQVFFTFAPFVLILNYQASTEVIATLYGIHALLNIFLNPLLGKLIDRIGYKLVLIADASFLILICLLYGYSHHLFAPPIAYLVVAVVFVADGVLFIVGMARALYVRSVSSSQQELTATLSTGISINHLFSIVIALLGGWLWERLGVELLFLCAAGFGVGALIFSWCLPTPPEPTSRVVPE